MDKKKASDLLKIIKQSKPKILVLGDVMLDHYIYGDVERISPEAPVPIINYKKERNVLGGAGNVVGNLSNIGCEVYLASIFGDDLDGNALKEIFLRLNVGSDYVITSKNTNTTKKTRFLSGGTQLLRLDNDSRGILDVDSTLMIIKVLNDIEKFDCIIISDYDKGVCDSQITKKIIEEANKKNIPIYVDPKGSNWTKYKRATCITPNTKEVEFELKKNLIEETDFENAARKLLDRLKLKSCLITRGARGMFFLDSQNIINQKVGKKEVFDVSGAGDTVIACLAASTASNLSLKDSIALSSFVSSEVVSYSGTTPFSLKMWNKNEK